MSRIYIFFNCAFENNVVDTSVCDCGMLQCVTTVYRSLAVAKSAKACSMQKQQQSALIDIKNAQIIVGTSCAGTGLDLQSVKNVIVTGLPYSVEQLLQWAGRCREDGMVTIFVPKSHFKESNELTSITP